ncbi:site-specific integrase [Bradyrhizobium sp. SZCCHNR3118]|uniref:site-specific integrase n=1 Tax=Bradyrhizobium sp. SZCCHNR3118 TaxID=3057468 RepID=UPI002916C093|nr:site-specific integrase [Bradyrhizobium sp. SZCCHNR3118]
MSRNSKGPRLHKRGTRFNKDGSIKRHPVWVVLDGGKEISTGVAASPDQSKAPEAAERFLTEYLIKKHKTDRTVKDIEHIKIDTVLSIYLEDNVDSDKPDDDLTVDERQLMQRIARLSEYWGEKVLTEINTKAGKGYVKFRAEKNIEKAIEEEKQRAEKEGRKPDLAAARERASTGTGGPRRDLEVLRAAINHHGKENLHYGTVNVWLPEKGDSRNRWLERSEAARMLWAAYRYREVQTIHVGPHKGEKVITGRRPLRHVARFLLIGFYTGTRAGAIASAAKTRAAGKSFVDLENGIYYRKAVGKKETNKRQPPAPIPPRLLAHLRRWDRLGIAKEHFVEWNGKPVLSVKKAFRTVVKMAGIDTEIENVTPHTLRHTAATWLMQRGTNMWVAAGYLGMTVEVLERVYGHHHPAYQAEAVANITAKAKKRARE